MTREIENPDAPRWKQRVRIPLYQWITVNVIVIGLVIGAGFGSVLYWRDQRAAQARRDSAIEYTALQAIYINERDDRVQCEQRVESRDQLRSVFIGIVEEIGADEEILGRVTAFLDEFYPPLDLGDCPRSPSPPAPPNLE